jgi:hypothetical protein
MLLVASPWIDTCNDSLQKSESSLFPVKIAKWLGSSSHNSVTRPTTRTRPCTTARPGPVYKQIQVFRKGESPNAFKTSQIECSSNCSSFLPSLELPGNLLKLELHSKTKVARSDEEANASLLALFASFGLVVSCFLYLVPFSLCDSRWISC